MLVGYGRSVIGGRSVIKHVIVLYLTLSLEFKLTLKLNSLLYTTYYYLKLLTYLTGESATRVSRPLLPSPHQTTLSTPMPSQQYQSDVLKEA